MTHIECPWQLPIRSTHQVIHRSIARPQRCQSQKSTTVLVFHRSPPSHADQETLLVLSLAIVYEEESLFSDVGALRGSEPQAEETCPTAGHLVIAAWKPDNMSADNTLFVGGAIRIATAVGRDHVFSGRNHDFHQVNTFSASWAKCDCIVHSHLPSFRYTNVVSRNLPPGSRNAVGESLGPKKQAGKALWCSKGLSMLCVCGKHVRVEAQRRTTW